MRLPLQITYRDIEPTPALEDTIRDKAAKLDKFYDRIMGCRVMVEGPHQRHRKGKLYHVRIDLTVPGNEIVIGRNPHQHEEHEDIYIAIRDAFRAARRALQDHARIQRHDVKKHVTA